ncbi:MAG: hypothetical protein AB8H47_15185 [Bacteroidia bacterium]
MKTYFIGLLFLFVGVSPLMLSAQSFNEPVEYFNYIAERQRQVLNKHIRYVSHSVHSDNYRDIERRRIQLIKELNQSIRQLERIQPLKGDNKLRNTAIEVFEEYLAAFNVEFKESLSLKQNSQDSYEAMEKYFAAQDKAEEKLQKSGEKFDKAVEAFAEKHEMQFEKDNESEIADQFKITGEVNSYTRELFLLYFKVSKSNAGFIDALNERKEGKMAKAREELIATTAEALQSIETKSDFKGDKNLLVKTKSLIEYYQEIAQGDYATLTGIMENQASLTQEQVDQYNQILQNLPTKEQKMVNEYTEARTALMRKFVPDIEVAKK